MIRPFIKALILLTFLTLSFTACNDKNANTNSKDSSANAAKESNVKAGVKPQADAQVAVIETADYGNLCVSLRLHPGFDV